MKQRTKTLARALVAALVLAAIAAPASTARPIDLGVPNTQDAHAGSGSSLDPQGPVYWSYEYAASRPHERSPSTGEDSPWMIIGLGVTGASLLVGGVALVSRTRGRARRARIAA